MKTIDLVKGTFSIAGWPLGLIAYVLEALIPIIRKTVSPEETIDLIGKTVEDMIEKGKESGVDEMKIIVNSKVGLHLKSKFKDTKYPEITFVVGYDSNLEINVKYK